MVRELRDPSGGGIPIEFARSSQRYVPRKRKSSGLSGLVKTAGILVALVVVGGLGYVVLIQDRSSLAILDIGDQEITQGDKLRMRIPLDLSGFDPEQLTYSLSGAPPGATIDRRTGEFSWAPTESEDPGTYQMTVKVVAAGERPRSDRRTFTIHLRKRAERGEKTFRSSNRRASYQIPRPRRMS